MISESYSKRKYLIDYLGVIDYSKTNEYRFTDMVSKVGICKPKIKSLSKKQSLKKRGK